MLGGNRYLIKISNAQGFLVNKSNWSKAISVKFNDYNYLHSCKWKLNLKGMGFQSCFIKISPTTNNLHKFAVILIKTMINISTYLLHPLQKIIRDCLGKPSVMSTWVRKHAIHILEGLDSIGVPHWQHKLFKKNVTINKNTKTQNCYSKSNNYVIVKSQVVGNYGQ